MDADKALELATKAFPNDIEFRTAYMLGLNEGYELHKEQMMKEAVEGYLVANGLNDLQVKTANLGDRGYYQGDKVRIIIVKEH